MSSFDQTISAVLALSQEDPESAEAELRELVANQVFSADERAILTLALGQVLMAKLDGEATERFNSVARSSDVSRRIRRTAEQLRAGDFENRYLAAARARFDDPATGEALLRALIGDPNITPDERAKSRVQLAILTFSRFDTEAFELLQANIDDPKVKRSLRRDAFDLLQRHKQHTRTFEIAMSTDVAGDERAKAKGQIALALRVHDPEQASRLLRDALSEPSLPVDWRRQFEAHRADEQQGKWQKERQGFREEIDKPGYYQP